MSAAGELMVEGGPATHVISDRASLAQARTRIDLDEVVVETARLKARNLLPLALRRSLWSLRPGGRLVVRDDTPEMAGPAPFEGSRGLIRQWVFKTVGGECDIVDLGPDRIDLRRRTPVPPPGWSAGVVFSGDDREIPTLLASLDGLLRQPELSAATGGEIVVCGPERDLSFLTGRSGVRYLPLDLPQGPRFLIGRKKNHLMASLTNPRMVILHARIVLEEGALAAVPREFDIASPDVYIATPRGPRRYLSLVQNDAVMPGVLPRRGDLLLRDAPAGDPLALHERGPVFVDGGAFYVSRSTFEACPLHPEIAWNEGEDLEWAGRAYALGRMSELAVGSRATSQTSKLSDWSVLGRAEAPARAGLRGYRTLKGAASSFWQQLAGRR